VKGTEEPKMPPKGDRLTDAELSMLEKWIAGQLLETANGKAVAAASNQVQVAAVSLERPAGPPPMPGDLPLEPFVRTARPNALTALGASPWAPLVAVGGQKQIILYNTETLEPLGILPFPEGFPAIIRFSRNGQLLLTGGGLGGKSGRSRCGTCRPAHASPPSAMKSIRCSQRISARISSSSRSVGRTRS
jgi:hypothetical protein